MAIVQSLWGKGQKVAPLSGMAGVTQVEKFSIALTTDAGASDIIELGVLPAGATVVDAILVSDELGTITLSAGLMSGTVGSTDAGRTCGTELFSAAADASVVRASLATAFRIAPTDADRSIGVVPSGTITASGQVIELVVFYRQ